MTFDVQHQPRTGLPDLLPEVAALDPASTVAGALELLPRPGLDPFQRLALAFLAEYPTNSAQAYQSDLRTWARWTLTVAAVHPLEARRHHVAAWVRKLTTEPTLRTGKPLAAASVARRLACLSKFYGYGLEVGVLTHSPIPHVRRPKVSDDSASVGLSRDELGRVLDTAAAHSPRSSALVHLLAFNGLRITEALNADIGDLIHDRGHRALRITRKGGKVGRVAIAPVTSRALDTYIADRTTGPIFLNPDGVSWLRSLVRFLAAEGRAVLLSSHLIGEVAQTADRVVVLGRGRVIADDTVAGLTARTGGPTTRVSSRQATQLEPLLRAAGGTTARVGASTVEVTGLTPEQIARVAAEHRIVLTELAAVSASLEAAFFALTRDALEYRASAPPHPAGFLQDPS